MLIVLSPSFIDITPWPGPPGVSAAWAWAVLTVEV